MAYIGWEASLYVVAAITGCWRRESGINPGIWEGLDDLRIEYDENAWSYIYGTDGPNKGGYGMGQWTNTGADSMRLLNLHNYVTDPAYNFGDGDGQGQLRFMIHERTWFNSPVTRGNYTSLQEFITSDSGSIEDLVWDFMANWEGAAGNNIPERIQYAYLNFEYIANHIDDDYSSYTWTSGNYYLTESQMHGNLMKVWEFFGNGVVPPLSGKKRHRMPIWMYI